MPQSLYPQERPGTHCIRGWLGPRAGLEECGKSHPPLGFDPQTVHCQRAITELFLFRKLLTKLPSKYSTVTMYLRKPDE